MSKKIKWNENGWTVVQEADADKHILEVNCYAENGMVTEVRMRHNHGEVDTLKEKLDDTHSLPMSLDEFKKAFTANEIKLK